MQAGNGDETCWSLVHRAAAGDGESRSRFGRTYLPLVRSFLAGRWRNTRFAPDVDDAAQDVFVECFRANGPLLRADATTGSFRGFLFGIVRNVAMRVEARGVVQAPGSAAESTGTPPAAEIADAADSSSRQFDREWARALMREAGELMQHRAADDGARQRVALLRLRFGEALPLRDIAARWQLDVEVLRRACVRAREEFRSCLRHVVAFHAVRTETDLDDECRRLFALLA